MLPSFSLGQVDLPHVPPDSPVSVTAGAVTRWSEGEREVYWLSNGCEFRQGPKTISASEAIVWLDRAGEFSLSPHRMTLYCESVKIAYLAEQTGSESPEIPVIHPIRMEAETWHGDLRTHQPIEFDFSVTASSPPDPLPSLYDRAHQATVAIESPLTIAPVQFNQPFRQGLENPTLIPPLIPQTPIIPSPSAGPGTAERRVRVFPRSNVRMQYDSFLTENGEERVTTVDSGVNILIEGIGPLGTVDISTDRVVIWSPPSAGGPVSGADGSSSALEFYMEGNIVFRQADRVIYATSMYYNVAQETGVVLDAELLSSIPNYPGVVRLRADVLRQLNRSQFQAHQAALTTSRMGVPSYWFQSQDMAFEDRQQPVMDPISGLPAVDFQGQPIVKNQRLAVSRNNHIYLGDTPIFYWPFLSTDLSQPSNYINRVSIRSDRVFGTQLGAEVNLNKIFNLGDRIPGDWGASVDYLSDRGWGFGTNYDYVLNRFLGITGETRGFVDAWFINEQGLDNLGADRRALVPEEDFRGRVLWQHRQRTLSGLQITGEVGWISDRNFLEQYYEREWDQWKDQSTGLELKYLRGASSWNLAADFRINEFFTETEWLPRLDHFQLGQALGEHLTWFGHSHVGYAKLKTASTPTDPVDAAKFNPLAWEVASEGLRIGGRHEIDLPLQLGDFRVVPYALGEVMHWGDDINGASNTRMYGQAGVRASLPMWSVDPNFSSMLFNMNGLAHKVVWEGEFLYAEADRDLDQFPLYDPLDDNAIEHFRRRFVDDEFGGTPGVPDLVPRKFDERYYALRRGLQSWVTSPSTEIADDLTLLRLGVRQRWQTKRGTPGMERVVDWMTLDMQGTFFPNANRDNFGQDVGMLQYDWRWHIGDRLTLMSDGYADTFGDGLRIFNLGGYISRPARGSAYVGFRSIEGPISSEVLDASFSYRMSPKWIASVGTAVDFGPTGNIGQVFELTRIGESFLVSVGANVDASRDNVGFSFSVEPRALPLRRRRLVGGVPIAPPGAYGLE